MLNARKAHNTTAAHSETLKVRVLRRCHVRSAIATRAKCVCTPTCRLAFVRSWLFRVLCRCAYRDYLLLSYQTWLLAVLSINCTVLICACACDSMHRRPSFRRVSCHSATTISYPLHREIACAILSYALLVDTGGATTKDTHDHM